MHTMPLAALAILSGRTAPSGEEGDLPSAVVWAFGIAVLLGVLAAIISAVRRR